MSAWEDCSTNTERKKYTALQGEQNLLAALYIDKERLKKKYIYIYVFKKTIQDWEGGNWKYNLSGT